MPINMLPHILAYFRAEKSASLYILLIGAAAVLISVWLWSSKSSLRGMALPLILFAVVESGVGGTVYFRTDQQIDTLTEQYYSNPAGFKSAETARMDNVMMRIRIYKVVEVILLIVGIALLIIFRARPFIMSAGAGLVIQAGILLVFDWIAAQRAALYMDALSRMK